MTSRVDMWQWEYYKLNVARDTNIILEMTQLTTQSADCDIYVKRGTSVLAIVAFLGAFIDMYILQAHIQLISAMTGVIFHYKQTFAMSSTMPRLELGILA